MPESSFFLPLLLKAALLPLAVALAVLAAGRAAGARVAPVLAITLGFLAAFFAILGGQWSPLPRQATDWLPWLAALGAIAAVAVERIPGDAARIAARACVALVVGGITVSSGIASFGMGKAVLAAVAIALVIAALWTLLVRPAQAAATRPLLFTVVAGGAGLALMLDSAQSLGQLSGALAMTLAACTLLALPRFGGGFPPAAAGVAVLVFGTLLANAQLYAGFSLGYVALLAGALLVDPLLAALRRSGLPWVPAAVLTAIPVLVTVGMAVKAVQDSGGY